MYWLEELDDPPYPPLAAVQTVLDRHAGEIPAPARQTRASSWTTAFCAS